MKKGLFITGHARHGKDTAGEILREEFGLDFQSSSYFAASRVIYPAIGHDYGYSTVDKCFEDRHSPGMRAKWFQLISEYNSPDPTRLSRAIFEDYPVYVGIRNHLELEAMRDHKDWDTLTLWIDASDRLPPEPSDSMTLTKSHADIIIDNNGPECDFYSKVAKFGKLYTASVSRMETLPKTRV